MTCGVLAGIDEELLKLALNAIKNNKIKNMETTMMKKRVIEILVAIDTKTLEL